MFRFLVAASFCVFAHAAPPVPQKPPEPARAGEVAVPAELIKSAAASTRVAQDAPREVRPAAPSATEPESQPDTRDMVFAAIALMVGIAVRRYGVGRK